MLQGLSPRGMADYSQIIKQTKLKNNYKDISGITHIYVKDTNEVIEFKPERKEKYYDKSN